MENQDRVEDVATGCEDCQAGQQYTQFLKQGVFVGLSSTGEMAKSTVKDEENGVGDDEIEYCGKGKGGRYR